MQQTVAQLPGSPVATIGGNSNWLGGVTNLLKESFGMYLQYEDTKNRQHAIMPIVERQNLVEMPNGGATLLERSPVMPGQAAQQQAAPDVFNVFGVKVPKAVAYVGGALLAALAAKKAGLL